MAEILKYEKNAKKILKCQEITKKNLMEALENYKKIRIDVNRLNMFKINENAITRVYGSSESNEKHSYYNLSLSSGVSPTITSNTKKHSKHVINDDKEYTRKEDVKKRIKELQQLYAKLQLDETNSLRKSNNNRRESLLTKTHIITEDSNDSVTSKVPSVPKAVTNHSGSPGILK
jgi:hypothetical protein